jgi:hypothetical protein
MITPNPLNPSPLIDLRLTRAVEADPRRKAIETFLKKNCKPLWEKSTLLVPHISLTPSLEACLRAMHNRRQLERGLERIDQLLNNEQKGILALQQKQGTQPSQRVSRVFLVSNDGSERFYRASEKTLLQHQDRVLFLYIDEPSSRLTQILMGKTDKTLKALLVSDRDAVSSLLFSLVEGEEKKDSL